MKPSKLMLDSKINIPFVEGTATIHPPTIREIALMGEEAFFSASHLLTFSKEKFLSFQDKKRLENTSNFDIFMQVMNDSSSMEIQETKGQVLMLLVLLFPDYEVHFEQNQINLISNNGNVDGHIGNDNYEEFKEIINTIFCMKPLDTDEYKPIGQLSQKIAEKLAAAKKKVAELKGQNQNGINIFQRYISILSIGLQLDKNILYDYTVHQLYDVFERYQLKIAYDIHTQSLLAGAKMESDPPNWQKDLDDKSNDQS